MSSYKDENLEELFGGFYESFEAKQAAKDIKQGMELFHTAEQLKLSSDAAAGIRKKMQERIANKKTKRNLKIIQRLVSAAAVILIALVVFVNVPDEGKKATPVPSGWQWDSFSSVEDDVAISSLTAGIDYIENEFISTESDSDTLNCSSEIDELEMELIAFNSEFWKG